jgi:hypothetical protein
MHKISKILIYISYSCIALFFIFGLYGASILFYEIGGIIGVMCVVLLGIAVFSLILSTIIEDTI